MLNRLNSIFGKTPIDWSFVLKKLQENGLSIVNTSKMVEIIKDPDIIDDEDEKFCNFCQKDTMHAFTGYGHERDSSQEMYTCLTCHWWSMGDDEQQHPPIDSPKIISMKDRKEKQLMKKVLEKHRRER